MNQSQRSQLCQPITAWQASGELIVDQATLGPPTTLSFGKYERFWPPARSHQTLMLDETLKCQPASAGCCNISVKPLKSDYACV